MLRTALECRNSIDYSFGDHGKPLSYAYAFVDYADAIRELSVQVMLLR